MTCWPEIADRDILAPSNSGDVQILRLSGSSVFVKLSGGESPRRVRECVLDDLCSHGVMTASPF